MADTRVHTLSCDHQGVLAAIDRLEVAAAFDPADEASRSALREGARTFIDFFTSRVAPHIAEEEEHVYPHLARALPPESGTLAAMLADHETIRALVAAMEVALVGEDEDALRDLSSHSHDVATLLREHIRKEDHAVFPLVEKFVDAMQRKGGSHAGG